MVGRVSAFQAHTSSIIVASSGLLAHLTIRNKRVDSKKHLVDKEIIFSLNNKGDCLDDNEAVGNR